MLDRITPASTPESLSNPLPAVSGFDNFLEHLLPESEMKPSAIEDVLALPSFAEKLKACERQWRMPFCQMSHPMQDAVVLRRLQQMIGIMRLNPLWKERIERCGLSDVPRDFEEWQQVPLADRGTMRELYMGTRPGLVVPLSHGGFEIVASGGTSGGLPVETVYGLRELQSTYRVAGEFMGRYLFQPGMAGDGPKWVFTTLADYQMWSSGTMVGGVLQAVPNINYIGAGPVRKEVFQHILSYPGPKAILGITQGIAILTELGLGLDAAARGSLRLGLYGSGVLPHRKQVELKQLYPNIEIRSYFAATQAETIGLQLTQAPWLTAVPGLHLIEIVDENGRWVAEGETGELVVTRLHANRAPLLRLKLGDRMTRRPRLEGPGLKAQQFEFAGRSGDVIHLCDTQYSAARTYEELCNRLMIAGVLDLRGLAHEIQFVNNRGSRTLCLMASVDNAEMFTARVRAFLGQDGIRGIFTEALAGSLSLFNMGEANADYLEKTRYSYELRLVSPWSREIHRTELGKVPLIVDHSSAQAQ